MSDAHQLYQDSLKRVPRPEHWLWWTLVGVLVHHEPDDYRHRGTLSDKSLGDTEIERMLAQIDRCGITKALEKFLRDDEAEYRDHAQRSQASAQAAAEALQCRLNDIAQEYS